MNTLLIIFAFVSGMCIFSFLNVVIYRVPQGISFVKGRSFCPSCEHQLKAIDMVPVVSWLCLRGKCRYCGEKISPRYAVVELLGGAAALACVYRFGFAPASAAVFAFIAVLTVVALIDSDTMEIPNGCSIAIVILSAAAYFAMPQVTLIDRGVGLVCVSVPMLVIALLTGGFGGGDIKLMAAAGLFLGWKLNLTALVLAIFSGGAWGIYLLSTKKKGKKDKFAFGPFLCAGLAVASLYGEKIISAYLSLF